MKRSPSDLRHLADRLRGEFRGGDIEEYVRPRRLQIDDLRIDGRIGGLVRNFGNDRDLAFEAVLETLHVVLTVIVVLDEDADLAAGMVLDEILRVDTPFALV